MIDAVVAGVVLAGMPIKAVAVAYRGASWRRYLPAVAGACVAGQAVSLATITAAALLS